MATDRPVALRPLAAAEAATCEEILRSLPEWFGIEEAIVQYGRDLKNMDTRVAETDGRIAGFITLNRHNPHTAEIHIIAVRAAYHRSGIGRRLVDHAEQTLRAESVEFLEVKTLGPSKPSAPYDRTRAFYTALGFRPVEETNLWGEDNPCLIMIKHLPPERAASATGAMKWSWTYQPLGQFTYTLLPPDQIKPFLVKWLIQEWAIDHREAPDEPWTVEWLALLPKMDFTLEILDLDAVHPRPDLMGHSTSTYSFIEDLQERAAEREVSLLRGVSTEPLVVNRDGYELMDGYTRYLVMKKYEQKQVYAYVGTVR